MIDITSSKVVTPVSLFLALSPGLLLTVSGSGVAFRNGRTGLVPILVHALVFALLYSVVARATRLVLTRTDLIVTALLFALLSPGLLLTLPPSSGGVFRSGQTSTQAVVTHAVVYAIIFASLRKLFPSYY
jgi:hypothetical protein